MSKSLEIQFLITKEESITSISKLVNLLYKQQKKVLVLYNNLQECEILDESLWSYEDISFTPHNIYSKENMSLSPVLIAHKDFIPQNSRYNIHKNFQRYNEII